MTTFIGRQCPKCKNTKRYSSSNQCVTCAIEKARQQTAEYREKSKRSAAVYKPGNSPKKPSRPKGYPTFPNEYGEIVPEDPIWVKFMRGEEIGEIQE